MAGVSTAATLCTESNLKVILFEKNAIGSNQAIRAVFREAVEEFGLEDSVLQKYTGFIWHNPSGVFAKFDYKTVKLLALDYQKACHILFNRACSYGLKTYPVKALSWSLQHPIDQKPLVVHLDNGTSIQAEILVDASGTAQWAARQLKIKLSPLYSICYGELFKGCRMEDEQYFRFLGPNSVYGNGGGWMYPAGEKTISMGYSVVVRHFNIEETNLVNGYMSAKNEFQPYAGWVKNGIRERIEGGIVPVGRIGRFVSDRILIVGDAAGQAHPWSVEGCRPSLFNGRLVAKTIMLAFDRKAFDHRTLSVYEREWSKTNRERFWRSKSVADISWGRTDQDCDQFVFAMNKLSPTAQLEILKENTASLFEKIYAVGGYARRQAVRWFKEKYKRCF